MSSLQAVAMGLVIVFLDVGGDTWDWIADPVGWVLVLLGLAPLKELIPDHRGAVLSAWLCLVVSVITFPPDSVDSLDPTLGWLFSLPTIAFCFVLCDALGDTPSETLPPGRGIPLAVRFRWLRVAFVVVGILPLLVYVVGWEWLTVPTAVAAVLTNVTLVLWVWAAGNEPEDSDAKDTLAALRARRQTATASGSSSSAPSTAPAAKPARRTPTPEPEKASRDSKQDGGFDAEAVKRRVRRERQAWLERQERDG